MNQISGYELRWFISGGKPAGNAKRLVTAAINAEEFALMKGRHCFDEERFSERLRQLPAWMRDEAQRPNYHMHWTRR